jgi:hypothetical protein
MVAKIDVLVTMVFLYIFALWLIVCTLAVKNAGMLGSSMNVLLIFNANNVAIFIVIIVLLREDYEQKVDINGYHNHKVFF